MHAVTLWHKALQQSLHAHEYRCAHAVCLTMDMLRTAMPVLTMRCSVRLSQQHTQGWQGQTRDECGWQVGEGDSLGVAGAYLQGRGGSEPGTC